MTEKISIPTGDKGFKLNFTCKNADGTVRDLTVYTAVNIKVWKPGVPGTLLLDKPCAALAANGTCNYTVQATDFTGGVYPAVGRYAYELEGTTATVAESCDSGFLTITESG